MEQPNSLLKATKSSLQTYLTAISTAVSNPPAYGESSFHWPPSSAFWLPTLPFYDIFCHSSAGQQEPTSPPAQSLFPLLCAQYEDRRPCVPTHETSPGGRNLSETAFPSGSMLLEQPPLAVPSPAAWHLPLFNCCRPKVIPGTTFRTSILESLEPAFRIGSKRSDPVQRKPTTLSTVGCITSGRQSPRDSETPLQPPQSDRKWAPFAHPVFLTPNHLPRRPPTG
ncbi:hypothetical protein DFP72DRAFT_559389 [Ephemerocybe angulata]|uniref:Uncharacterized protein n=1 Tax=Ephemerocybe angulata TaxID=980116 RepID=A0A8H6IE02_9AGAR|nr:hypothetical protein DFP72DRAFT_559389 [Tulosesus angulatus]